MLDPVDTMSEDDKMRARSLARKILPPIPCQKSRLPTVKSYRLALMKVLNADNENFEFTLVGEGNSGASVQDQTEEVEMQFEEWLQREKDKARSSEC